MSLPQQDEQVPIRLRAVLSPGVRGCFSIFLSSSLNATQLCETCRGETDHAHSGRSPCRKRSKFRFNPNQAQLCTRLHTYNACPWDLYLSVLAVWVHSFFPGKTACRRRRLLQYTGVGVVGALTDGRVIFGTEAWEPSPICSWSKYGGKEGCLPVSSRQPWQGNLPTDIPSSALRLCSLATLSPASSTVRLLLAVFHTGRGACLFSPGRQLAGLLGGPAV